VRRVEESITLVFPDDEKLTITLAPGQVADEVADAIIKREGEYATGWVADDKRRKIYNISAAIRIDITRSTDPPPASKY
jgi:hypothetical protein